MYTIYLDKEENFECNLQLEGASLKKSICRLIIESPEITILCNGTIDADGGVFIPIKKLKHVIDEGVSGNLQLEVIADGDTFFVPWKESFETKFSKKVTVEVKTKTDNKSVIHEKLITKPTATVSFDTNKNVNYNLSKKQLLECMKEFGKVIMMNNITLNNMSNKNVILVECFKKLCKTYKIEKQDMQLIIDNVIKMIESKNI